jgi:hypothetical protein
MTGDSLSVYTKQDVQVLNAHLGDAADMKAYLNSVVRITPWARKKAKPKVLDSVRRHDETMAQEAEFEEGSRGRAFAQLAKGRIESRDAGPGVNITFNGTLARM